MAGRIAARASILRRVRNRRTFRGGRVGVRVDEGGDEDREVYARWTPLPKMRRAIRFTDQKEGDETTRCQGFRR